MLDDLEVVDDQEQRRAGVALDLPEKVDDWLLSQPHATNTRAPAASSEHNRIRFTRFPLLRTDRDCPECSRDERRRILWFASTDNFR